MIATILKALSYYLEPDTAATSFQSIAERWLPGLRSHRLNRTYGECTTLSSLIEKFGTEENPTETGQGSILLLVR